MNETGFRQIRNRNRAKAERTILILRIVFLAMILAGLVLLVWFWDRNSKREDPVATAGQELKAPPVKKVTISWNGKNYEQRDDLEVTLLIGTDSYSDELEEAGEEGEPKYSQCDLVMLIVADPETKTYTVLHINRDTMCKVPILDDDTGAELAIWDLQLALAYAYGGPTPYTCSMNVIRAVKSLLPTANIKHYVTLTMDSVGVLNDMVGGVRLEVLQNIDEELVKGKTVRLKGEQALKYVRARKTLEDPSNLSRMERQKQFLTAFQEQFREASSKDYSLVLDSLMEIKDYLNSDCTTQQLSDIVNTFMEYKLKDYRTVKGENQPGEMFLEYIPDADDLQQLSMELFFREIP